MRGMTRTGGVHAGGAIFLGALREVESEFVVEIAIELIAMEERAKAGEKLFWPGWHCETLLSLLVT
jgi:hypothetical protein